MSEDPAVEEVRKRRRKLLEEKYQNSIRNLLSEGNKWEREHPDKTVDLHNRKEETQNAS